MPRTSTPADTMFTAYARGHESFSDTPVPDEYAVAESGLKGNYGAIVGGSAGATEKLSVARNSEYTDATGIPSESGGYPSQFTGEASPGAFGNVRVSPHSPKDV